MWIVVAAWFASILVFCAFFMKTMIPLRLIAMTTNLLFITWSLLAAVYPTLILNCILLPINSLRFFQMISPLFLLKAIAMLLAVAMQISLSPSISGLDE